MSRATGRPSYKNCSYSDGLGGALGRQVRAEDLFDLGIDVLTTGNHVWDKKEVLDYIPRQPKPAIRAAA